ncbi:unnamed protein product [Closterium sp. Yama58-4]|nr:unnamed protein product [Closterium sp. Yama58-4]
MLLPCQYNVALPPAILSCFDLVHVMLDTPDQTPVHDYSVARHILTMPHSLAFFPPSQYNVALPPAILSRFDLVHVMLDTPDQVHDYSVARHILTMPSLLLPSLPTPPHQYNVALPPAILSRFDLVHVMLDTPDPVHDYSVARHILTVHHALHDFSPPTPHLSLPPISTTWPCHQPSSPITEEAKARLVEAYVSLRQETPPRGCSRHTESPSASRPPMSASIHKPPHQITEEAKTRLVEAYVSLRRGDASLGSQPSYQITHSCFFVSQCLPSTRPFHQITEEAKTRLVEAYVSLRRGDAAPGSQSSYRITVRQLEALVRLSEALARLHLDSQVGEAVGMGGDSGGSDRGGGGGGLGGRAEASGGREDMETDGGANGTTGTEGGEKEASDQQTQSGGDATRKGKEKKQEAAAAEDKAKEGDAANGGEDKEAGQKKTKPAAPLRVPYDKLQRVTALLVTYIRQKEAEEASEEASLAGSEATGTGEGGEEGERGREGGGEGGEEDGGTRKRRRVGGVHGGLGGGGAKQGEVMRWYMEQQSQAGTVDSVGNLLQEFRVLRSIIQHLIRREGVLLILDDGTTAVEAARKEREDAIAAAEAAGEPVPTFDKPLPTALEERYNVALPPAILSRFDLVHVMLDTPDPVHDYSVARHILTVHQSRDRALQPEFSTLQLQKYIKFARSIRPEITEEAKTRLVEAYVSLRRGDASLGSQPSYQITHSCFFVSQCLPSTRPFHQITEEAKTRLVEAYVSLRRGDAAPGSQSSYRITVRQLEALVRLSEALARLHLDSQVKPAHVREAKRLLNSANHAIPRPLSSIQLEVCGAGSHS